MLSQRLIHFRLRSNPGFALVVVLILVSLMTILIVAIFATSTSQMRIADASGAGQTSKQLADTAVQLVISQIQKGTTQGANFSWASQPGMIRCYDSSGQEAKWYKLYSSQQMVEVAPGAAALSLLAADIPAGGWMEPNSPGYGVFTDMNSPMISERGGGLAYPILDPTYTVQGLAIDQSSVPTGYNPSLPASATNNPAPMPVRWLYLLADGRLVPGQQSGAPGEVNVAGSDPRTNPILGRIAFWTDDETCKLNINTAGDGTYFDTPRFTSSSPLITPATDQQKMADKQLAVTPPVANECQRFIGHPAQTRLSYVLPRVTSLDSTSRSQIMTQLSPFMQWGGSAGGTRTIWSTALDLIAPNRPTTYASLDEWLFSTYMAGQDRKANSDLTSADLVTNTEMQGLRFLLSATSEAPEVNLYGKPRIAMWPIHNKLLTDAATPYSTTQDKMIAYTATVNKQGSTGAGTYYFTRANSMSPTSDYADIPRNKEIFSFLRRQAASAVPGYGGQFNTKYTVSGMTQILTEIFDYIRSTNPSDPALLPLVSAGTNYSYASYRSEVRQAEFQPNQIYRYPGQCQVTPIYIADYGTKGFGRIYTVSEVAVDFTRTSTPPSTGAETAPFTMCCNVYLGLFCPALGPGNLQSNIRVQIDGLDTMKADVDGVSKRLFPVLSNGRVYSSIPIQTRWHAGSNHPFLWGGAAGPRQLFVWKNAGTTAAGEHMNGGYYFSGVPITATPTSKLSLTQEQTLKIKIFHAGFTKTTGSSDSTDGDGFTGRPEELIQELTVAIPPVSNLPAPAAPPLDPDLTNRYRNAVFGQPAYDNAPIYIEDTIRSVVTGYDGDMRLIAAQRNVPATAFVKHPDYDNTALRTAHSLRDMFHAGNTTKGAGFRTRGFVSTGKLVQAATYAAPSGGPPVTPVCGLIDPTKSPDVTGDWDNGPSVFPDGPYINKADEVGLQYYLWGSNGSTNPSDYPYYSGGDNGDSPTSLRYSSPNRVVASPVMFGSLSTGVPIGSTAAVPWRTLLFRPQSNHFGMQSPKDSLILDWFWMPVVEPYSISTPMATAGKVNLNYQLAPFSYITRATALMGVLGSEVIIAVPTDHSAKYKDKNTIGVNYRFPVKVLEDDNKTVGETTGTLRQLMQRFSTGGIFRSVADICDIYLVPGKAIGSTVPAESWTTDAQAEAFWAKNKLSGDNSRERTYNGLYSRLTTKSNTFTTHVRVQVLRTPINTPPGKWIEMPDRIISEYRGSMIINRYLNPEDTNIPDFIQPAADSDSLDNYYKYRVLETRRFLP